MLQYFGNIFKFLSSTATSFPNFKMACPLAVPAPPLWSCPRPGTAAVLHPPRPSAPCLLASVVSSLASPAHPLPRLAPITTPSLVPVWVTCHHDSDVSADFFPLVIHIHYRKLYVVSLAFLTSGLSGSSRAGSCPVSVPEAQPPPRLLLIAHRWFPGAFEGHPLARPLPPAGVHLLTSCVLGPASPWPVVLGEPARWHSG